MFQADSSAECGEGGTRTGGGKPMTNKALTVDRMMRTIARAYLAVGNKRGAVELIKLPYTKLQQEFEWAVVTLTNRQLLTEDEEKVAAEYAQDKMYGLQKSGT